MRKKISALIAVRSGSKRVINKNIRPFANTNLLEIKIKQLLRTGVADEIIVSSDCEKMLKIAKDLGVKPIKREEYYTSDSVPMNEVYKHLADLCSYPHVLYVHVTSPLLSDKSLSECIKEYSCLDEPYDSLASVTKMHEYIWNKSKAVNYDPDHHPRSQDLPEYYSLNFAVNIISKKDMINRRNIVGKKFYPYFLNKLESIDVDTMFDFEIAEFMYSKRNKVEKL